MPDDLLKIKIPTGVRVHSKVTRICKVPELYMYDEHDGFKIKKWRILDVHMCTKFIEGRVTADREENGVLRRKERYYVELWPEKEFSPTPEILNFIEKKKLSGSYNPLVHTYPPPAESLKEMANIAKELYFARKENDRNRPMTFKPQELQGNSQFVGYIKPKELKDGEEPWMEEPDNRLENDEKIVRCMSVVEEQVTEYYVSKNVPWPIMKYQLSDPYWKAIYNMFDYQKTIMVSMIAEMDVDEFERLNDERLKEVFDMARMSTCPKNEERSK